MKHLFTLIKGFVMIFILITLIGSLFSGSFFFFTGLYHLAVGWCYYLVRTLPNITFKWSSIAFFVIACTLLLYATHRFVNWLVTQTKDIEEKEATPVPWSWTIKGLFLVILAFAAGISAVGMVHQTSWLLSGKERVLVGGIRSAANQMMSASNMRNCMMAMHNYHTDFKQLPSVFRMDKKTAQPLLSWRVTLLPYLENDELFKKFKLDEPWDSTHNLAVVFNNPMPSVYRHPDKSDNNSKETHYRAFYSRPGTKVSAGLTFNDKITLGMIREADGIANTVCLFEGEPVLWTKPDDIEIADHLILPTFKPFWRNNYFQAAMFDGSIQSVRIDTPPEQLRALATYNGKEKIDTEAIFD